MKGKTVAGLLRQIREEQGQTLRGASDALGLAPSQLSRLERGERRTSPTVVAKLATYYGISKELVELADGRIPEDIVKILQDHPEELDRIRANYNTLEGQ